MQQEVGKDLVKEHGNEADVNNVMGVCNDRELACDGGGCIRGRDNKLEGDQFMGIVGQWVRDGAGLVEP